jgi:N-acetylmuramoyl-L-alanine amidase
MGGPITPSLLVLHYTVSWPARAVVAGFTRKEAKASAHLVLDLDGMFTQMVPFNLRAWHAGESTWRGQPGCNGYAIGIEVVGPGPLFRDPGTTSVVRDVNKRIWLGGAEEHVPPAGTPAHWRLWAAYTPEQIAALETVCRELVREYGIREIVGHSDVSPGRKYDPGPAMPMDRIRRAAGLADTLPPPIAPELPVLDLTLPRTTGEAVRLLQTRLVHHMRPVTVDGTLGPLTSAAVFDFQKARGLEPTGRTDVATWELLNRE